MLFLHRLLQSFAPQHLLTVAIGKLANSKRFAKPFIHWFAKRYQVNMEEAKVKDLTAYETFNAFFTRALKDGARAIDDSPLSIVSPADGTLSEFSAINGGRIIQAKGQTFTVNEFLGGSIHQAEPFLTGDFFTVYLSPKDYHRVHFPFDCQIEKMTYIPGKLFSVSLKTAQAVPRLFARNERLCVFVKTQWGPAVIVLVGAMIVAGMNVTWQGDIVRESDVHHWAYPNARTTTTHFKKGEQLGHFNLGSTVVVLLGFKATAFIKSLEKEMPIQMGMPIMAQTEGDV